MPGSYSLVLAWAVCIVGGSALLHEFGHAWTARAVGWTVVRAGRVGGGGTMPPSGIAARGKTRPTQFEHWRWGPCRDDRLRADKARS